jgi:NitT/TauT family transport system permease protein
MAPEAELVARLDGAPGRAPAAVDLVKAGPGGPDDGAAPDPPHDRALAGLDALDLPLERPRAGASRVWSALWPKLAAVALFIAAWQIVVWSGWKPEYVLPAPGTALKELWHRLGTGDFYEALGRTGQRAAIGYALAILIGGLFGLAVARVPVVRTAIGSFITALQTMPSIVWFPLAILLFQLTESAILFVVVLGAAPSIANGVVAGIDYVPPQLTRVGRIMGARGLSLYRHVIIPAALPSMVAGLKQGWAFAWRSLMAGELLVVVAGHPSIGTVLENDRQFNDAPGVVASMLVIFIIGVVVDTAFSAADRELRSRRGLLVDVRA